MTPTEFCETRVLPLMLAFACGMLVTDVVREHRDARAMAIARRAMAVVETYREACVPALPPAEMPAADLKGIAEARR